VARRYGIRLDQPHAAVALRYDGPDLHTWATALTWIESAVRTDGPRAWSVVGGDVAREAVWMQRRLQPFVRGPVRVAAGPVVAGAAQTPGSFEVVDLVLELLRARRDRTELTFDELGLTGLLLAVPEAQLQAFVDRCVGPLLDRPDLLATLEAWYATGGSRAGVADAVAIHRNSVGHRMDRIRALLGADPDAADVSGDLRAALAAREVLLARRSLRSGGA
jgi:sugar diacid utilization regulator